MVCLIFSVAFWNNEKVVLDNFLMHVNSFLFAKKYRVGDSNSDTYLWRNSRWEIVEPSFTFCVLCNLQQQ